MKLLDKLKHKFGFHDWVYYMHCNRRRCTICGLKQQYSSIAKDWKEYDSTM